MTSGYRPTNNWGDGDLPAPYAEGDVIDVPEGARALERMQTYGTMGPGRYKVVYATSIDQGDAWYFRLGKKLTGDDPVSDRLHVAYNDRTEYDWGHDVNWLDGCTLVRTADPDGLARREQMLADGWTYERSKRCPTCGQKVTT